jgi:hypothetical protein
VLRMTARLPSLIFSRRVDFEKDRHWSFSIEVAVDLLVI